MALPQTLRSMRPRTGRWRHSKGEEDVHEPGEGVHEPGEDVHEPGEGVHEPGEGEEDDVRAGEERVQLGGNVVAKMSLKRTIATAMWYRLAGGLRQRRGRPP
eukprot:6010967-Heterocapsa_arctica.AAC.1